MHHFTILPIGKLQPVLELETSDWSEILRLVDAGEIQSGDVMEDDRYAFSVELHRSGMWVIFQRCQRYLQQVTSYG
ncbi:hypothetical protein [Novosphingobium sp. PY1]|uniref:hypothetical protein n=1 Tax=Novosphingobium sp. PY1 TaxID=1882221 RepID=UPI001A8D250F|nr:hypothetical protein [Novosphingobium sp. PY1]GFM30713.1 uncharacterized protein PY1_contig-12-74 [Novosphingobium sp. PY1]